MIFDRESSIAVIASFLVLLSAHSPVAAQSNVCEEKLRPNTTTAVTVGAATAAGFVVGTKACSGFLLALFVDLGLSYGLCVAASGAVGGIGGTILAEDLNQKEKARCRAETASR